MSEELACKNKRYPHGCHPHYAKKYHGYCLECANAGIPELDEELAAQSAEIERLRADLADERRRADDAVEACDQARDSLLAATARAAEVERQAAGLREACGAAESLHALVETLAYTLRNALPAETPNESINVRQDRCVSVDCVGAADDLIRQVRAALAAPEGRPQ